MKLRSVVFLAIAMFFMFRPDFAFADSPSITHLLIDGTVLLSDEDFKKANLGATAFARKLLEKSLNRSEKGKADDWFSINYFGADQDYDWTAYVKCSDTLNMLRMMSRACEKKHPKFPHEPAIYTAAGNAINEMVGYERRLQVAENTYLKNIVLITAGKDNSLHENLRKLVQKTLPKENKHIRLYMIGVGPESDLSKFNGIATLIWNIDNFDSLENALTALFQFMQPE